MTQEEKQLLFKVLCEMLPYGVICNLYDPEDADKKFKLKELSNLIISVLDSGGIKPYLRPLSTMTEEEDKDWQFYKGRVAESCDELLEERIA